MKYPSKSHTSPELRRRRIVSLVSLGAALLVMGLLAWFVGKPLIDFIGEPEQFRAWVESHGVWGGLLLVAVRILQTIITILPAEAVEIGAGYAFGAWIGWLLCTLGTAIGSAVICLLTRKFGMRMVEAFVSRERIESLRFLRDRKRTYLLVFLLFFIPGTPKDTLTYLIGLTPMRLPACLLLMSVARIPSILSSTLGGEALGNQDYHLAVWIFGVTAVVSAIGMAAYALSSRRRGKAAGVNPKSCGRYAWGYRDSRRSKSESVRAVTAEKSTASVN